MTCAGQAVPRSPSPSRGSHRHWALSHYPAGGVPAGLVPVDDGNQAARRRSVVLAGDHHVAPVQVGMRKDNGPAVSSVRPASSGKSRWGFHSGWWRHEQRARKSVEGGEVLERPGVGVSCVAGIHAGRQGQVGDDAIYIYTKMRPMKTALYVLPSSVDRGLSGSVYLP